jgi:endonuclease YncB( thermonuclease family)
LRRGFPLLLAVLTTACVSRGELEYTVSHVEDGDSVTVATDKHSYRVRLIDIDAPERRQAFGKESENSLREICLSKPANMDVRGKDRYGRTLARVTCAGVDASSEQVRRGMAWVFVKYAPAGSPLYRLESDAKMRRLGLWADPRPVAPWEWRATR